jgi:uncharacterized protein YndB with AHSA1/START domain
MTAPAATAKATHGSFTLERRFNAKPARVFAAFADLEARKRWFVGPPGWVELERSLDFRQGGSEVTVGQWPDGKQSDFRARFEEIVPDQRIVFTYNMHIGDWHISVSLNTVEFFPDGAGTKMLFTEHATFINGFDDPDAAGRKQGSEGLLDRLEAFLAG